MQSYTTLFFIVLFFSCTTIKKSGSAINGLPQKLAFNKPVETDNKIAFLTLEVTLKDSVKETYEFKFVRIFFADGTLPNNSDSETLVPEPGYFYCAISEDEKTRSDYIKVKNPLKIVYEYADEAGQLKQSLVIKNKAEVFIRFQYNKNHKFLSIYTLLNNSSQFKKIYLATL